MTQPMVTCLRDKFLKSWPKSSARGGVVVYDLATALTTVWRTDVHMAQYTSEQGCRLSRDALQHGATATIDTIVFDVDCPVVHGTKLPAPEIWRFGMKKKVERLFKRHPDGLWYETRGGGRLVYKHPGTFRVLSMDDERLWSQRYAVHIAYLKRKFDIEVDTACADWTRLFRVPHATRDQQPEPEFWPVIGDARTIGVLDIRPEPQDLETAESKSKAFKACSRLTFAQNAIIGGQGLLFHAMRAKGWIIRPRGDSSYLVKCPQEHLHSSGSTGDSSTVLYPPANNERIGAICCLHAHCSGMTVKDWLKYFTREELLAAERAAGMK